MNGISDTNSTNVNAVTLNATGALAGQGFITFATTLSVFNDSLFANALQGMDVNANVTSTTAALVLDGDSNDTDDLGEDDIDFTAGRTLTAASTITLSATFADMTGAGALTLNAQDGININDSLTTAGITTLNSDTVDFGDNVGTLNVADSATVSSGGFALNITANDLDLNATGALTSGVAATSITDSDNSGIGLGDTAVANGLNISGAELQRITATGLTLTTGGGITVNNITAANSNNVSGVLTLDATVGTTGSISFLTTASFFNALAGNADNGVTVNVALTTDTGALALDGDVDNATAGAITFAAGLTMTAETSMTLDATTGDISGAGALTLNAKDGVTINDSLTSAGILAINSDTDQPDNSGTLTVATGATVSSGGFALNITANDLDLVGNLTSGAAITTINDSDGTGIGLGATAVANGLNITDAELGRMTAVSLTLNTAGNITVNGISDANSTNVNAVTLNATGAAASQGFITFATTASVFNDTLTARSRHRPDNR